MGVDIRRRKWRRDYTRRKVPKVRWELMKNEEIRRRYEEEVGRRLREVKEEEGEEDGRSTKYGRLAECAVLAAKEICGVEEKSVENPWMVGKEEELRRLKGRVAVAVESRNEAAGNKREEEVRRWRGELKEARKEMNRELKRWENEWWVGILDECENAASRGD